MAGGCNTYRASFAGDYQMGQYQQAEARLRQEADGALESASNGDHLLYNLELGTVQRTLNQISASEQSFNTCEAYFARVDQRADIRVGRSLKAGVTNLAELAYEGYPYDRLMLNAYQALNYMQEGNSNFARAELKRIAYTQEAIERNKAARIKELEAEGADTQHYNARASSDPGIAAQTRLLYSEVPENTVKNAYLNAFAEYLQGIFLLHAGDADDQEIARASLRRTLQMNAMAYVQQDLDLVDVPMSQRPPITYVIFESGMAPLREEVRIDIPVWAFNLIVHDTGVDYFGVAFPKLVPVAGGMDWINVATTGGSYPTQMLVNMDGVVAREFKDELPTVVTRTIIASASKAGLAYAANYATRNDSLLNLAARLATTAYQYTLNSADLRTWRTLPKIICVARFDTPTDGVVKLASPNGAAMPQVQVDPKASNIIWVRAPGGMETAVCRAFSLKRYN